MSTLAVIAIAYALGCGAYVAFTAGRIKGFDEGLEVGLESFEEATEQAFRAGFTARRLAEDAEREGQVKVLDPAYVEAQRRAGRGRYQ